MILEDKQAVLLTCAWLTLSTWIATLSADNLAKSRQKASTIKIPPRAVATVRSLMP